MSSVQHFKFTAHPVADVWLPPLNEAALLKWLARPGGLAEVEAYWLRHEDLVADAAKDPLMHGFEPPYWRDVRAMIARKAITAMLGGNGTGKTEFGGKIVLERLLSRKGAKVLCVAANADVSKQLQQPAVYKYLPVDLRTRNDSGMTRKRSTKENITYSQKGGFTESTFVLPGGSQCWFKTVEQFLDNETSFEGPEYDFVWIDEPAPKNLVDTLKFRAGKVGGKVLQTFTAIYGFDATCAELLTGARIVRSLPINFMWDLAERAKCSKNAYGTLGNFVFSAIFVVKSMVMTKYVCYYRVSTREQGDSKLGLGAQETTCKAFVSRQEGEIVSTFSEVESGKNNRRPELLKAINEAKRKGATLLIAKLDRLSRNAGFIFLLRDSKVDFVCADMPSANSVTIGIMAVLAQEEAERTSQRTRDALAQLKARGVKLGNPNIAMYAKKGNAAAQANRDNRENPNAAVIGLIINKRLQKKTFSQIANELNELNMRSTYGKAFTGDNVRIIFSNAKRMVNK